MFDKILIANRGEIACRIIKTAHKMGVKTVAVYSDADSSAQHVKMADEAVHIGASSVSESYLRGDIIIAAALKMGAQAIHPGYGFLSENPEFVDAVKAAGLVFIGPSAKSIRAMGLKDAAKVLMEKAGVPVVPGFHGESQDADFLAQEAEKIGYPVLIKARAGGGGKGMRKVDNAANFLSSLQSAQREGLSSFGDGHVLIEKYITAPRHIEVQVFGDNHGNVVHLFERDCSLQRRHQKVIEEAPAPGMTAEMRQAMTDAAVTAAKAINYSGAGTIEFIVDGSGDLDVNGFWFMEMNTRLQVEHPVTEAITGQDLVEWQLCVAAGEVLPCAQEDLTIDGHAFEARLYAEDADNGFLPATGTLKHVRFGDARIDTGIVAGNDVSPFYDPMIAKVITHGSTRSDALKSMRHALAQTHIAGTKTNIRFLSALCHHTGFSQGEVDTGLIERDLEMLTRLPQRSDVIMAFAALHVLGLDVSASDLGWRLWGGAKHKFDLVFGDEIVSREILLDGPRRLGIFSPDDQSVIWLENISIDGSQIEGWFGTQKVNADVVSFMRADGSVGVSVLADGIPWVFTKIDLLNQADALSANSDLVVAPMTGIVQLVDVKAGDKVVTGQQLIVVEAMKMEHRLLAPRDAIVSTVNCAVGGAVDDGSVLVTFETSDA